MPAAAPAFAAVPFHRVRVTDAFWAPRVATNRTVTIPAIHHQLETTGRLASLKGDWQPGQPNKPHIFYDSDIAKWLEAACYSLTTHPDAALRAQVESVIALVASRQLPDGYLNSYYSIVEPGKRWTNLRDCHELYCAGHLMEAAAAHFQATGERHFLDVLSRYADHIGRTFGPGEGQKRGYCGHEEVELALVKLWRASGEQRHLDLARYFVDERGRLPHYYDVEAKARGEDPTRFWARTYQYCQAHLPVREQSEVVGHAVRATYLYTAMTDLAAITGDAELRAASERLCHHLRTRRLYLTGGIGPSAHNEGFTTDYDLPNESAYAETCAAIGLVFWMQRLVNLTGHGVYADLMERALYNGVLSGVSLDGRLFLYVNPLAVNRRAGAGPGEWRTLDRQPFFGCACCPPNVARLLAAFGGFIYGEADREVAVHLYVGGTADLRVAGQALQLTQTTNYPWDGTIALTVTPERPTDFTLRLRLPGWCPRYQVRVNRRRIAAPELAGYLHLLRRWRPGDQVTLTLDMPPRRVYAHPAIEADWGRVALMRGPLVYCVEGADVGQGCEALVLPKAAKLRVAARSDLLGGVQTIHADGLRLAGPTDADRLYLDAPSPALPVPLTAVPYYAWGNRGAGDLRVWLRER